MTKPGSRDLWNTSRETAAEGYEYNKEVTYAKTPIVDMIKYSPRGNFHRTLPARIPDILTFRPAKEPGCNTLLEFSRRTGREDQLLYRQSEMYRNISNQNRKEERATKDRNAPMFSPAQIEYILTLKKPLV